MFWMLLPPSANAGRHFEAYPRPEIASWGTLLRVSWGMVLHLFRPTRR